MKIVLEGKPENNYSNTFFFSSNTDSIEQLIEILKNLHPDYTNYTNYTNFAI